jgi:hypothetical protein
MVASYYLESMSSKTLVFILLLRAIARVLMQRDIRPKLTYMYAAANVLADCLSRGGRGIRALFANMVPPAPDVLRWRDPLQRHRRQTHVTNTRAQDTSSSCFACTSKGITSLCPSPTLYSACTSSDIAHCRPREPRNKVVCHFATCTSDYWVSRGFHRQSSS